MRKRGPDVGTRLGQTLDRSARAAGITAFVAGEETVPWVSATFAGATHRITIGFAPSPEVNTWLDGLPGTELPIRGHFVADIAVVEQAADHAMIEALTLIAG